MKPTFPSVEQVRQLPLALQKTIPASFEDANGHMNIRHYVALFDESGWPFFEQIGLGGDYIKTARRGVFDVQHHLNYVNEVLIGEDVGIYFRVMGVGEKRLHGVGFMLNETRDNLACTLEFLSLHIDLDARRTTPIAPEIKARLDAMAAEHAALDWTPPLCGTMGV